MLIKKTFSKEEIIRCTSDNGWDFGNSIIYEMCRKNPYHVDADIIVGKIWIIGRAYAAAIERRKNVESDNMGDDFYFNIVAPKIIEIGRELDERIACLKSHPNITYNNLIEIVETHKFLTDVFSDISGLSKRSLASKYLHFHVPNMFYIYDSRAIKGARRYVNSEKSLYNKLILYGDKEYIELVARLFPLQLYIENEFKILANPRMIDSFLLGY